MFDSDMRCTGKGCDMKLSDAMQQMRMDMDGGRREVYECSECQSITICVSRKPDQ